MKAQRIIIAAAAAATAIITSASPSLAQSVGVSVVVNGQQMTFDQPPEEQAGRVFVPLRGIFEQLGASVVYQNGTINATGQGRNVSLHIGSTQAYVNGQSQTLDSPPFVQGSRTLVPLRFVAQALGANVDWNNSTSTVTITGGGYNNNPGYNPGPPPPMNPNGYIRNRQPFGVAPGPQPAISGNFAVPVRPDSVRVLLDGRDVTSAVYFNRNGFEFTPGRPLYPGRHNVRVSGVTRDGASFSTGWDFRV
jgi:hypothetical protein